MQSKSQPLVSVVIPCYNHEQFVQGCIQSVIDQSYQNIELIIIDDGSNDSSVEKIQHMVAACQQRFVRFEFRYRSNKGLSATLNEALEWCEGEYYSAIASDDMMLQHKTQEQVDFLNKNTKIVALFGGVILINECNSIVGKNICLNKQYSFKDIIMHQHNLPAPTQMIRLKKLKSVGGYDVDIYIEDWFMWLKLTENGDALYCMNRLFCLYRQHENNTSKKIEIIAKGRMDILKKFNDSKYYKKAVKNIKWLNSVDKIYSSEHSKLSKRVRVFLLNPFKAFILFIAQFRLFIVKNEK